jgi:hypothetical protein
MDLGLGEINKGLETITKSVDDNIYSAEEQDKEITERLRIDNATGSLIPMLVRPVSFGWSILNLSVTQVMIVILAFKYMNDPTAVIIGVSATWSGLVGMMAKFYFQSRGNEKIERLKAITESKKIEAAIKIEAIKNKVELKEEVKDNRAERREKRKPLFGSKK